MSRGRIVALVVLATAFVVLGIGVAGMLDDESSPVVPGLAAALAQARAAGAPFESLTSVRLALGDDCLRLAVADDESERGDGLRGVTDLGRYDGMLFVFPGDTTARFTMSGVTEPLAIGFYDGAGAPVGRDEMAPCPTGSVVDCPLYGPKGPFRFAVETPGGALPAGALGGCP